MQPSATIAQDKVIENRKVYQTTNYAQFKHLEGNRDLKEADIKSFAKVLLKENLTDKFPIEINQHGFVLDGQKRLAAAQYAQLPICYVVLENATIDTVIVRNTNMKNWNWLDFAQSWAKRDKLPYKQFMMLYNEYGYNFHIILQYAGYNSGLRTTDSRYENRGSVLRGFRSGEFTFKDFELTKKLLTQYRELVEEAGEKSHSREFANAAYSFMRTPQYSHNFMKQKVRAYGDDLLRCYTVTDFLLELDKISKA